MPTSSLATRRTILLGGAALPVLLLCSAAWSAPRPPLPQIVVHRDPGCGCCGNWAAQARRAGYPVRLVDEPDMPGLKRRLGVPQQLEACHTSVVADYVIEGHVPFEAIAWLLGRHPRGVRGLGVPGMPVGSPGMESPDGRHEPYQVFAFNTAGRVAPLH